MKIAMAALMATGLIAVSAIPTFAEVRSALCKVIVLDSELDKATFMDENGDVWCWPDTDDIHAGDFYSVCFDTKGTANIGDDDIISIHYEHHASWK